LLLKLIRCKNNTQLGAKSKFRKYLAFVTLNNISYHIWPTENTNDLAYS